MDYKETKIILADDHTIFRSGIKEIIQSDPSLTVIDDAEDGDQLIKKCGELNPDIIIVDISMPKLSGIEAVKEIKKDNSSVKVLFLSMYKGDDYLYHCVKAGGNGLISKNIEKEELISSIKKIINGEDYFGSDYTSEDVNRIIKKFNDLKKKPVKIGNTKITAKEKEVLNYLSNGMTGKDISNKMNISKKTVDHYRSQLMQKLNLKSLSELIKFAIDYSSGKKF